MSSLPVYAPPGLANSHAIACPARASLAHLEFLAGFCSSQKWWSLSRKLRRLVCPSRSVQVVMSANVATALILPTESLRLEARLLRKMGKENSMSDNLKDRGPQDRSRINVNEDWELRYWTKELGVSEDRLRQAVQKAGVSADA